MTYWTVEGEPASLDLSLRSIPDGTLGGTLVGAFDLRGDLEGDLHLDLTLDGFIEDDGAGGTSRVAGTTHVTGTATSAWGAYTVDLMR